LNIKTAAGCADNAIKILSNFSDKPVAAFRVSPEKLCQGTDNVFTDESSPAGDIKAWNWNFADGTTSTLPSPSKRYTQPGEYNVVLTVTNTDGCISDPSATPPVTVYLQPEIDAGPPLAVPQGTRIQLEGRSNSASPLFRWEPATDLSDASVLLPTLIVDHDETYTLTATGDYGCTASDFVTVKVLRKVQVPNVFSPNGDGINDRWQLPNLSDYPGCTVEVFNRYGQRVFYSVGYSFSWDGTQGGKPLPVGTYYYIITLKNGFQPLNGSVTIIR
jgi:gliding motility-associated-like protein